MMNSRHIYAISIIATGLIIWGGGPATASGSEEPGGDLASGYPNEVFCGTPDPDSPGGTKAAGSSNSKAIKGEVLRIEGDQYYVGGEDGKEVGLHIDSTTQKTGDIQTGDRIEAQANEQSHALSIRPAPTTDRRNEHSSQ